MPETLTKQHIEETFQALSNWGRWGEDDEVGTLNNVRPEDIVAAAGLIRKGKVFGLGVPLDQPLQSVPHKRWNPIHTFMQDGADVATGLFEGRLQYADDAINMPTHGSTHWDALAHVFSDGRMYNGHDAGDHGSRGFKVNGIEKMADRMVGRGVLLDVARFKGAESLDDEYAISNEELDACAAAQDVAVGRGDFVIVRTGYQERFWTRGDWAGHTTGMAPGLAFETCRWLREKDVAAIAADNYAVEARPAEGEGYSYPWHGVVIPAMGLTMGEMFYLRELAADCAEDGVYEFFFCAPPLNLPGGSGSPINPQAIK